MMRKTQVTRAIKRVDRWLRLSGWDVVRSANVVDMADFDSCILYNKKTRSDECMLYSLLHECGHVIDGEDAVSRISFTEPKKKKTRKWRVAVVVGEMRAWDSGARLASALRIKIDREKFDTYRARYLGKYFYWGALGDKSLLKSGYCD